MILESAFKTLRKLFLLWKASNIYTKVEKSNELSYTDNPVLAMIKTCCICFI